MRPEAGQATTSSPTSSWDVAVPETLLIGDRPAGPNQRARYRAILSAALELADTGGHEAVQMRAVADLSGNALATIYRYFGSRERLICAATQAWLGQTTMTAAALDADPTAGPLDALIKLVRSSGRALAEHPRLLQAWVRANHTDDPLVCELLRTSRFRDVLHDLLRTYDLSDALARDVTRISEQIWFAGITRWAYGQKAYADVPEDVERAIALTFAAHAHLPLPR